MAQTYSELLRRWNSASDLAADLAAEGCEASETLIRRWWNEEMLPPRAFRPLVAAAAKRGFTEITLELLASIAEAPRATRRALATTPEAVTA